MKSKGSTRIVQLCAVLLSTAIFGCAAKPQKLDRRVQRATTNLIAELGLGITSTNSSFRDLQLARGTRDEYNFTLFMDGVTMAKPADLSQRSVRKVRYEQMADSRLSGPARLAVLADETAVEELGVDHKWRIYLAPSQTVENFLSKHPVGYYVYFNSDPRVIAFLFEGTSCLIIGNNWEFKHDR